MLQGEHSAILSTCSKLSFVIKIFVLSIFEWLFYTGFTVHVYVTTCMYHRSACTFTVWFCHLHALYRSAFLLFLVAEYSKCSKISKTSLFLFSNKTLVISAGIHKMLIISKQSELSLPCLSRPFWEETGYFRAFTVKVTSIVCPHP